VRKKIFDIIELAVGENKASAIYDSIMIVVIILSLLPLAFKVTTPFLTTLDYVTAAVFILDYALRMYTADLKLKKGPVSFLLYPFTPLAIIDLLCILPTFAGIAGGLRILKVIRLARAFRVFRAFKMLRYSKSIGIIIDVIRTQKAPLIAVGTLAAGYVLLSALIIFNVEPDSFDNFFEAVYWATVSLTTVGYGDIYPVSTAGRVITMLSSLFGIAVVALPSGIITAGYMARVRNDKTEPVKRRFDVDVE